MLFYFFHIGLDETACEIGTYNSFNKINIQEESTFMCYWTSCMKQHVNTKHKLLGEDGSELRRLFLNVLDSRIKVLYGLDLKRIECVNALMSPFNLM